MHWSDKKHIFLLSCQPVDQRSNFPGFLHFIPNCKEILWKMAGICHNVPRLSSTKIGLQVLILSTGFSIFSIYIPGWLKSFFFFCPGWEWESSCGGGRRASWLIRILQREQRWVVWRFWVWVWNTGWHRPCLQPKMHTLKILFTQTSTKSADLGCVEGSISQKCKWELCRCLCRCLESTGPVHSCTEPRDTDSKLQTKSWKSWKA